MLEKNCPEPKFQIVLLDEPFHQNVIFLQKFCKRKVSFILASLKYYMWPLYSTARFRALYLIFHKISRCYFINTHFPKNFPKKKSFFHLKKSPYHSRPRHDIHPNFFWGHKCFLIRKKQVFLGFNRQNVKNTWPFLTQLLDGRPKGRTQV